MSTKTDARPCRSRSGRKEIDAMNEYEVYPLQDSKQDEDCQEPRTNHRRREVNDATEADWLGLELTVSGVEVEL